MPTGGIKEFFSEGKGSIRRRTKLSTLTGAVGGDSTRARGAAAAILAFTAAE
jgi:hypothetical protein